MKVIRAALEKRLATLSPSLPIAFENAAYTPVANAPYQAVTLLPNKTRSPAIDQRTKIKRGIFQVSVYYPLNQGTSAAGSRAELVCEHFYAGLVLTEGSRKIRISSHPSVASGMVDGTFYMIPVSIEFISIQ